MRALRSLTRPRTVLALGLALAAASQIGSAAWIHAKAELAQVLLERAWERTRQGGHAVRPWSWADTWPVARLRFPDAGEAMLVLAGGSGRTLAFGPGHLDGTPLPGAGGNSVIVGHRDTHFAVLERLRPGARIAVEVPGREIDYRVTETFVAHESAGRVLRDAGREQLTLVTCYPFHALVPGGPLRWVVRAEPLGRVARAP